MVLLHRVWKKNPVSVDFLGIYIANDNQYSPLVHGLIGTTFFIWRNIFFVSAFSQSFCLKEMVAACVFSYKNVFFSKEKSVFTIHCFYTGFFLWRFLKWFLRENDVFPTFFHMIFHGKLTFFLKRKLHLFDGKTHKNIIFTDESFRMTDVFCKKCFEIKKNLSCTIFSTSREEKTGKLFFLSEKKQNNSGEVCFDVWNWRKRKEKSYFTGFFHFP